MTAAKINSMRAGPGVVGEDSIIEGLRVVRAEGGVGGICEAGFAELSDVSVKENFEGIYEKVAISFSLVFVRESSRNDIRGEVAGNAKGEELLRSWPISQPRCNHVIPSFSIRIASVIDALNFVLVLSLLYSLRMEAAVKTFFASQRFAVAGASSDPSKFGYKGMGFDA